MTLFAAIKAFFDADATAPTLATAFPGGLHAGKAPAGTPFPWLTLTDLGSPPVDLIGCGTRRGQSYFEDRKFQLAAFCEGEEAADAAGELLKAKFDPATLPVGGTLPLGGTVSGFMGLTRTFYRVMEDPGGLSENQQPVWQAVLHYQVSTWGQLP